jgi:hypothetical protein
VGWLGELAKHSSELGAKGVAIYAVAADDQEHTADLQKTLGGVTLLRDEPSLASTAIWGLKVGDAEAPWPATYVIEQDGSIKWRHLRDEHGDWPTYAELASALDQK